MTVPDETPSKAAPAACENMITLLLCGDVMTGRGIDQILAHPCDPALYESCVKDARCYVDLAQEAHGPIPYPVAAEYIWGDALDEWRRAAPDARIVNLETAVTTSDRYWKGKCVHYRMSPQNVGCLKAADIDCCTLANNHLLDWGYAGLAETLETLRRAGIQTAGAGRSQEEAAAPAIVDFGAKGRVLVISLGSETSGIPTAWAAGEDRAGVNLLPDFSTATAKQVGKAIAPFRREGDVVVASIHWGGNWGYAVPCEQRQFAHELIDRAGVDLVHGHSSHHVKGIEVYRERLILYGCGDFLTDYEGIPGYEMFRGDLALMYFASVALSSGRLVRLHMTPVQVHRMRLRRTVEADSVWLASILNREGKSLRTRASMREDGLLALDWT
jgi:poly-gamma-glutamate capsule biosynthesis protein CapA/YwtB (metallophosphatase superfamily)